MNTLTGEVVRDRRYEVATLEDDDPQKLLTLRRLLASSDYMERLAAVKQLELMGTEAAITLLSEYLQAKLTSAGFDSVAPLAVEVLCLRKDVRTRAGLEAGRRYLTKWSRAEDLVGEIARKNLARIDRALAELARPPKTLLEAIDTKNLDAVERFLAAGSDVDERGRQDSTPLHWAVLGGHIGVIEALLAAGAKPDPADALGITPLWLAVGESRADAVARLLARGANPNFERGGARVLHLAVVRRAPGVVRSLLEAGAERDVRDPNGRTPLELAEGNESIRTLLRDVEPAP